MPPKETQRAQLPAREQAWVQVAQQLAPAQEQERTEALRRDEQQRYEALRREVESAEKQRREETAAARGRDRV